MVLLTLIQTSQNRRDCLRRFVESLNAQHGIELSKIQLIFVDQGDNKDIFESLNPQISFVYLHNNPCSLSHARNIAIPHVKGKYIAYPDDDCWYAPNTISYALEILQNGCYDGVSGKGTNENDVLTSIFPNESAEICPTNRCAAISYTMFFKFNAEVSFNEDMGVGSPYNFGAGEETDYLLQLIQKHHYRVLYDPNLIVHHPTGTKMDIVKAYSYARGAGYLMRLHSFPLSYILKQFCRPFGGVFFYLITGDFSMCRKSFLILKGRIEGILGIKQ